MKKTNTLKSADPVKVDVKKVGQFLKSISRADYIYLRNIMKIRDAICSLIKRHEFTKQDVISIFHLHPRTYSDFIAGNYNYSIMDIARLNAAEADFVVKEIGAQKVVTFQSEK